MDDKCRRFFESRVDELKDGVIHTTYINPDTKRRIKQCTPAYNKLLADCNAIITGKPRLAKPRTAKAHTRNNITKKKNISNSMSSIEPDVPDIPDVPDEPTTNKSKPKSKPKAKPKTNDKDITEVYIKQWIKRPLIDPRTNNRIYPYMRTTSEYAILHKIAYEYFLNAGFNSANIPNMLPTEHILFNSIDVLYYRIAPTEHANEQSLYKFLDDFLREHSGDSPSFDTGLYFNTEYSIDEHNVMIYIVSKLVDAMLKYMKYMEIFFNESYEKFPMYLDELEEYKNTLHIIKHFAEKISIASINNFDSKILAYAEKTLNKPLNVIQKLKGSANIINTLTAWYDELYNIFNYIRAPELSPYADLLVKVEDPIERMFRQLTRGDANAQELHKVLSDVGVLDLLKKSKRGAKGLLNKDRKYFKKCNNMTDPITQEDFASIEYPLAKLQLMYQLKDKKITHCFYAPEFYNYVVTEILARKKIIRNPLTNVALTNDNIHELVDVMRVVYPDIKDPLHYIDETPFDTKLELAITSARHTNSQTYYKMNVMRKLGDINVRVCNVCVIPKNMDKSDAFIKMIEELFANSELMYTYMSPFYINRDMYIRHDDVVCSYQEIEEWSSMPKQLQNQELTDYYEDIRKAFNLA